MLEPHLGRPGDGSSGFPLFAVKQRAPLFHSSGVLCSRSRSHSHVLSFVFLYLSFFFLSLSISRSPSRSLFDSLFITY